jgi:hypothetical protein
MIIQQHAAFMLMAATTASTIAFVYAETATAPRPVALMCPASPKQNGTIEWLQGYGSRGPSPGGAKWTVAQSGQAANADKR